MVYRVELVPAAARALDALPEKVYSQSQKRIDVLAKTPRPPGARKLEGHEGLWRVRSGDYRIVYQIENRKLLVLVVRIGNRREVYLGL